MRHAIGNALCALAMASVVVAALPRDAEAANQISIFCIEVKNSSCGVNPIPTPNITPTPTPTPTSTPTATPSPTPSPTPSGNCTNGSFSAPNHYPDSCYQPWATNSVWNTPFTSYTPAPTVTSSSATWTNYYVSGGYFPIVTNFGLKATNGSGTGAYSSNDYGHPIYFGQSTDSTYTVVCTQSYASAACPTGSYHIPSYALPAHGYANDGPGSTDYADHHMAVVDQTTNQEVDCWRVQSRTGGVLTADSCSNELVTGDGLNGQETRSGYRLWAGNIRQQELVANYIPHALFMVVPCTNAGPSVFPAVYLTGSDTLCPSSQGAPYGSFMKLNMTDAQIAALGVPAYKAAIYTALAHYGAYVADANNFASFGIQVESDQMYVSAGYTNANCPTNGAACTPATAYMHTLGDPNYNGSGYNIQLNDITYNSTTIQWFTVPPH